MIALFKACLLVCLCVANYGVGVFTTEKKYKKAEEKKDVRDNAMGGTV